MSSDYQVRVSGGVIKGINVNNSKGGYYSFLGIPYAEPPIGDLRFKNPVPKESWSEVLDATKEANCPPQLDMFTRDYIGSEDCLYLNVHTPGLPLNPSECSNLPVMVFFHGGAFLFMSGSSDWFSPEFIIGSKVVLVAINYRINALGYLCLDIPEAPGNMGLKDQLMALKWVKENITNFNGDPNNVTLFGMSSGAVSVECHLLSPLSKGLFQKAIMQSGSVLNPWAVNRNPKKQVYKLAKLLNINEPDPYKLCEQLRQVDVKQLISLTYKLIDEEDFRNCNLFPFTPVIEKRLEGVQPFLAEDPIKLIKAEKFTNVPTISGFCSEEGLFFKSHYPELLIKNMQDKIFKHLIPSYYDVDKDFVNEAFQNIYKENPEQNTNNFLSDLHFLSGIHESVVLRSSTPSSHNYAYMFSYEGRINFMKNAFKIPAMGALHGDESTYLSHSKYVQESEKTEEDDVVRKRMVKLWTDFAKYGNPTLENSLLIPFKWQPVQMDENIRLLKIDKDMEMIELPFLERLNLWRSVYKT